MTIDPKPQKRIKDADALRLAALTEDCCAACGARAGSVHHVIPRGEGGDDVAGNLLVLCGSGTDRCHGAWHGNPYVHHIGHGTGRLAPVGWEMKDLPVEMVERRDQEWVARRIGLTIVACRDDIIQYVEQKLGVEPGRAYMERRYYIRALDNDGTWESKGKE